MSWLLWELIDCIGFRLFISVEELYVPEYGWYGWPRLLTVDVDLWVSCWFGRECVGLTSFLFVKLIDGINGAFNFGTSTSIDDDVVERTSALFNDAFDVAFHWWDAVFDEITGLLSIRTWVVGGTDERWGIGIISISDIGDVWPRLLYSIDIGSDWYRWWWWSSDGDRLRSDT